MEFCHCKKKVPESREREKERSQLASLSTDTELQLCKVDGINSVQAPLSRRRDCMTNLQLVSPLVATAALAGSLPTLVTTADSILCPFFLAPEVWASLEVRVLHIEFYLKNWCTVRRSCFSVGLTPIFIITTEMIPRYWFTQRCMGSPTLNYVLFCQTWINLLQRLDPEYYRIFQFLRNWKPRSSSNNWDCTYTKRSIL